MFDYYSASLLQDPVFVLVFLYLLFQARPYWKDILACSLCITHKFVGIFFELDPLDPSADKQSHDDGHSYEKDLSDIVSSIVRVRPKPDAKPAALEQLWKSKTDADGPHKRTQIIYESSGSTHTR